jgi:hypothetical protein
VTKDYNKDLKTQKHMGKEKGVPFNQKRRKPPKTPTDNFMK